MIHRASIRFYLCLLFVGIIGVIAFETVHASDHLDTPTVIADPAADIGDIYAWTSSDGRRLNLVMDIVAHQFSNRLQYAFHVDSGQRLGKTTASTTIICRFDVANNVECWAGDKDYVRGDAHSPVGLESEKRTFRIFTGLRDDPFFNNVKGTREAYGVAGAALKNGTPVDSAGCPNFNKATAQAILDTWRHTSGGPAMNFLAGWKTSAIVISIDLDMVTAGGKLAAVWGTVHRMPHGHGHTAQITHGKDRRPAIPALGEPIERTARPLIKNGLVGGPLDPDAISNARKEAYSRVFRGKFTAELKQLLLQGKLQFHGSLQELAAPDHFQRFLRQLFTKDWVVYAKPPFGGAEHVLHYLARYTHRVAISNHRLVSFKDDQVSFRWKDYAAGSKQKVMTVSADEFLRRFLIHVLPKGLVRIRHFGLFANRKRSASLLRCRVLLNAAAPPTQSAPTAQIKCPLCSQLMLVIERFNSLQLLSALPSTPLIKPRLDSS